MHYTLCCIINWCGIEKNSGLNCNFETSASQFPTWKLHSRVLNLTFSSRNCKFALSHVDANFRGSQWSIFQLEERLARTIKMSNVQRETAMWCERDWVSGISLSRDYAPKYESAWDYRSHSGKLNWAHCTKSREVCSHRWYQESDGNNKSKARRE